MALTFSDNFYNAVGYMSTFGNVSNQMDALDIKNDNEDKLSDFGERLSKSLVYPFPNELEGFCGGHYAIESEEIVVLRRIISLFYYMYFF